MLQNKGIKHSILSYNFQTTRRKAKAFGVGVRNGVILATKMKGTVAQVLCKTQNNEALNDHIAGVRPIREEFCNRGPIRSQQLHDRAESDRRTFVLSTCSKGRLSQSFAQTPFPIPTFNFELLTNTHQKSNVTMKRTRDSYCTKRRKYNRFYTIIIYFHTLSNIGRT